MSQVKCDYHPQREAIEKCTTCKRLICLEDRQYLKQNSIGFFSNSSLQAFCSKCYYQRIKSLSSPFSKELAGGISFIILFFFGSFLLLFNVILGVNSSFLSSFFYGFIGLTISIIWLLYFIINKFSGTNYDIEYAKAESERLVLTQISQPRTPQEGDKVTLFKDELIFCMNCGTEANYNKSFCPQCGDPLHPAK